MGEKDEEDLPTTEDVNEAVKAIKAINALKLVWTEMSQKKSPIEEGMMALEEVVKKSHANSARQAAPVVSSGKPPPKTYVRS